MTPLRKRMIRELELRRTAYSFDERNNSSGKLRSAMRPRPSPAGILGGRNPEIVAAGEKMSKNHPAGFLGGDKLL